jgi:hypothetical protein
MMKIKDKDFEQLRDAMIPILTNNPEVWKEYKQKGLSKHQFCWDVFWATKPWDVPGATKPGSINHLHSYLNDANITTALMKICGPFMI